MYVANKIPYLWRNCFLFLIPSLALNALLSRQLPPAFQPNVFGVGIPLVISLPESVFRAVVMVLPALMPLAISTSIQRFGLLLFCAGTLIYFASWAALILAPLSAWSTSVYGFFAPACTPALWLAGLTAIGDRLVFERISYQRWMYGLGAGLFIVFHTAHASIVWLRLTR